MNFCPIILMQSMRVCFRNLFDRVYTEIKTARRLFIVVEWRFVRLAGISVDYLSRAMKSRLSPVSQGYAMMDASLRFDCTIVCTHTLGFLTRNLFVNSSARIFCRRRRHEVSSRDKTLFTPAFFFPLYICTRDAYSIMTIRQETIYIVFVFAGVLLSCAYVNFHVIDCFISRESVLRLNRERRKEEKFIPAFNILWKFHEFFKYLFGGK